MREWFTFQKETDLKSLMAAEGLIYPWIGATDIHGNDKFVFIGSDENLEDLSTVWAQGGYLAPQENWSGGSIPSQPDHQTDYDCAYACQPHGYNLITWRCSVADTFVCEKY